MNAYWLEWEENESPRGKSMMFIRDLSIGVRAMIWKSVDEWVSVVGEAGV